MTSVNLTPERVFATQHKLQLLARERGDFRLGAPPVSGSSFAVGFSNGVLHHTNDTDRALHQVDRVLKAGGRRS